MSDCVSNVGQKQLLTISIVTFNPDFAQLRKTLSSLSTALGQLQTDSVCITIIDNSIKDSISAFIESNFEHLPIRVVHGQGNIGFGRAHNLTLDDMGEFHLILNPDIELHPEALINACAFMEANPRCGLLTPHSQWPNGDRQYLCKRYPAVFDLLLRGFAPKALRSFFKKRLAHYEMQAETQEEIYWNPLIISGCFMFFRSHVLKQTNGFDEAYFLYFEDFDLSLRVHDFADIAYVPNISIIHAGGHAAKKGMWHINTFVRSSMLFYRNHGLKII
ncbi:glycosyltransferase [Brucella pituitosa]|uniref:Glycosyltransferase n=1 Tax=Brucella pituitosa TaxID=571256 RepID=A0ABS3K4U2_9HYPH|nr:glycosyltransferase [Brucella pituitosa]MBO1041462.1 glycosyltransferase [Brucella pituitosa]